MCISVGAARREAATDGIDRPSCLASQTASHYPTEWPASLPCNGLARDGPTLAEALEGRRVS